MTTDVVRDLEHSRYVIRRDGEVVGIAEYVDRGGVLVFHHTEIASALRGQGLGDELVRHALDDVRTRGLRIRPTCWFVAEYVDRHPRYADLVAA